MNPPGRVVLDELTKAPVTSGADDHARMVYGNTMQDASSSGGDGRTIDRGASDKVGERE